MLQVRPNLKNDREREIAEEPGVSNGIGKDATGGNGLGVHQPIDSLSAPLRRPNQLPIATVHSADARELQTRVPVVIGEATYRGVITVDGIISGQPGNHGGVLTLRQHGRTFYGTEPELNGEISFRDMLRVIGHIAGSVSSKKGTLIVDVGAKIDATVHVAIAIINGTVSGDIVAHQRVELGATAKIFGNIWTRSLAINSGAIFEGVCQMVENNQDCQ